LLPLGNKTECGQAMVIYPLGHGHSTKNGEIPFFTQFDARLLLLNFKIILDIFCKALDLDYRMNSLYNISSRSFLQKKNKLKKKKISNFFSLN
jgi:hypothetical protein